MENTEIKKENKNKCDKFSCDGTSGALYGLGLIGAAVYYIKTATTFGMIVIGFLKALVWPAFLVYELLQFLAM